MYSTWMLHSTGPREPICVIERHGTPRVITRLDEESQTRAEATANGHMLASAQVLFVQAVRFSECLDAILRGRFDPSPETLTFFAKEARTAIAQAEGCQRRHNADAAANMKACCA